MRQLMTRDSVFYLQKEVWDDIKEYQEGFKEVIKQREKVRIPFHHQSPQFVYRQHLVTYIKRLCTKNKLSYCCLHLAVYLLDIFMDSHSVTPDKLLLLANVSLLLAAKFEENNHVIPKISELNSAVNNRYGIQDYKDLEIIMLKFFSWYITFPTVAHYIHYFMQAIISYEDLMARKGRLRTLFYKLHDEVTYFLDQTIDDVHYMQTYVPSKLAAAIIAASRLRAGLTSWNSPLANLTDYEYDDIRELVLTLLINRGTSFRNCPKCNVVKLGY